MAEKEASVEISCIDFLGMVIDFPVVLICSRVKLLTNYLHERQSPSESHLQMPFTF